MNKLRELLDKHYADDSFPVWRRIPDDEMEELWPTLFMVGCRKTTSSAVPLVIHPVYGTVAIKSDHGWEVYMMDIRELLGEGDE